MHHMNGKAGRDERAKGVRAGHVAAMDHRLGALGPGESGNHVQGARAREGLR